MEYGRIHRVLLRTMAHRGAMSMIETQECLNKIFGEELTVSVEDLVRDINKQIQAFHQKIKITYDEYNNEEVLVFLSTICNAATKSQNLFSPSELDFFRLLIENIMSAVTRQISGINALNLAGKIKPKLAKTDAQRLLDMWCRFRYLLKVEDNYVLDVRTIHEFDGFFREHMPDTIEDCCLCKQTVFRGVSCPECSLAVHTRCFNKYLEKVQKWPCCKMEFRQEQLDQLHSEDSYRLIHPDTPPHQVEGTEQNEENAVAEGTEQDDEAQPGTSQQVIRNKKRRPVVVSESDTTDVSD